MAIDSSKDILILGRVNDKGKPTEAYVGTYRVDYSDVKSDILSSAGGLNYYGVADLKSAAAPGAQAIAEGDLIKLGADFTEGSDAVNASWGITTPNPLGMLSGQTIKAGELLLLSSGGFVRVTPPGAPGTAPVTFNYRGVLDVSAAKPGAEAVLADKEAFTVAAAGLAGATVDASWGSITGVVANAGDLLINQGGTLSVMASAAAPPGVLTAATRASLGGVKVGGDLNVAADGTLSVDFDSDSLDDQSGTAPLAVKLDPAGGVEAKAAGAGLSLKVATATELGGVQIADDSAISVDANGKVDVGLGAAGGLSKDATTGAISAGPVNLTEGSVPTKPVKIATLNRQDIEYDGIDLDLQETFAGDGDFNLAMLELKKIAQGGIVTKSKFTAAESKFPNTFLHYGIDPDAIVAHFNSLTSPRDKTKFIDFLANLSDYWVKGGTTAPPHRTVSSSLLLGVGKGLQINSTEIHKVEIRLATAGGLMTDALGALQLGNFAGLRPI